MDLTSLYDIKKDIWRDITQLIYAPETGNLMSKRYDDGKGPDYTYTQAGRLKQRIWARGERPITNTPPLVISKKSITKTRTHPMSNSNTTA